jgi:disulfide oxidoreductase YuzD
MKPGVKLNLIEIRQAVANYMSTEGCGCCVNYESHEEHKSTLGKLLKMKKYIDGSNYDYRKYVSKENQNDKVKTRSKQK